MLPKSMLTYSSKSNCFSRVVLGIMFLLLPSITGFLCGTGTLYAQSVGVNSNGAAPNASAMLDVDAANKGLLIPRVSLTAATDVTTIPSPAVSLLVYNKATAGAAPDNVVSGYYYWNGVKWIAFGGQSVSTIAFSTGPILSGANVLSSAPVLMGFGNHTTETVNYSGESTSPPEAGGFSFTVPFSGTIKNLQVSADMLAASVNAINFVGLRYDFTVFVSSSLNNAGVAQPSSPYVTTPVTTSVWFGFPYTTLSAGTFYSATSINTGSISVNAGDRIGIRIRTLQSSDISASDVTQLSFNASLSYVPAQ